MHKRRLAIGVDIDETLNTLIEHLLLEYNYRYNDNKKLSDMTHYDIQRFLNPQCKNIFSEFSSYSLMIGLDIDPYAVDTLCSINEHHDIYFVTAGYPNTMGPRNEWLSKHFPFYRSEQLIGCVHKQLLKLDVLVDDYEENLIGGDYLGCLITKPWNKSFDVASHQGIIRFDSLAELPSIIDEVTR